MDYTTVFKKQTVLTFKKEEKKQHYFNAYLMKIHIQYPKSGPLHNMQFYIKYNMYVHAQYDMYST